MMKGNAETLSGRKMYSSDKFLVIFLLEVSVLKIKCLPLPDKGVCVREREQLESLAAS